MTHSSRPHVSLRMRECTVLDGAHWNSITAIVNHLKCTNFIGQYRQQFDTVFISIAYINHRGIKAVPLLDRTVVRKWIYG